MRVFRLVLVLVAAVGPACRSADLQPLPFDQLPVCVAVDGAGDRVFRNAAEWEAFLASGRVTGQAAPDFAQVTVATHLDGAGSACTGFTVDEVVVSDSRVLVQATRHVFDGPCIAVIAYPQFSVAFASTDLPVDVRVREVATTTSRGAAACF